jgi:hypothetical protein
VSRDLPSGMPAQISANAIIPGILAVITFKSMTTYTWSGVGSLVYGGNTYLGVGSLGKVDRISEGVDVRSYGTTVGLSGINPTLLAETLSDIQLGASATISLALFDGSGNVLNAYVVFSGVVDKPTIAPGLKELSISLALETRLANLSRASNRRYTAADQNLYYPGDTAFNWVESLNDQALKWTP